MPKKKHKESASEQAVRFRAEVEKLIDDGELSPTEAEAALDNLVRSAKSSGRDQPKTRRINPAKPSQD